MLSGIEPVTTIRLNFFKMSDFQCQGEHCCGHSNLIEADFVQRLDILRAQLGFPLIVSSGYRCPIHNQEVSHTGATGPHTTGRAADLAISRGQAYALIGAALGSHFTGIGVSQKGDARFIHLDDLQNAPGQPRPTVWSY